MSESAYDLRCQACRYDDGTVIRSLNGVDVRHCHCCRLTSVANPVTTVSYDAEYVAQRYDRYPSTERMSELRADFVRGVIGLYDVLPRGETNPFLRGNTALDVGYGNGSFIRRLTYYGWNVFGCDVNPQPYAGVRQRTLPDPLSTTYRYRCITFFDALEHFEQLHQVRRVSACTDWIVVTAPLPPIGWPREAYPGRKGERCDIAGWKHWRPGEHHHYPHPETLERLFTWEDTVAGIRAVATLMHVSHFEDSIRGPGIDGQHNTFTCALRCTTVRGG